MLDQIPSFGGYETYALALVGLWGLRSVARRTKEWRSNRRRQTAIDEGSTEPPSLHPVIDPARCIGCGACTHACPEGSIIGLINGKASLLDPGACIGHGACKTACPAGAIDLVFGTARRGIDIPLVQPSFESSVPGVFIAGELGGMGLIANAIEQGRQAIESIARLDGLGQRGMVDVVIVGAGPAGFAASLAAKEKGLRCTTLEQSTLGGTVAHYPRGKIVMTRTARLPLFGQMRLRRVRKERLLELWARIARKTALRIDYGVRVEKVVRQPWGFEVRTSAGDIATRAVLLATGRRGAPRRLGVPGEDMAKVVYGLLDADQYRRQRVLVVGGGDSALEAAVELAKRRDIEVTLSHRGPSFSRAKAANRQALQQAEAARRLRVLRNSSVRLIRQHTVEMVIDGERYELDNDCVIVCAGGLLPTALLADIGVAVETKYGTA